LLLLQQMYFSQPSFILYFHEKSNFL